MRTTLTVLVAALLLVPPAARAQGPNGANGVDQAPVPLLSPAAVSPDGKFTNFIDFGLRGTSFDANSDEARFQRFRDMRNGGTIDLFRYADQTDTYKVNVQADHVGYRDQRYSATYNQFGKVKLSFEFNQMPLFFSQTTSTLYTSPSPGVLQMSDTIQSGLQNNKTLNYASVPGLATPFDLQLKRSVADFKLTYSATQALDINVALKNTQKTGSQPWAGTFGFSDAVELNVPIDTRTTELGVAADYASSRGSFRVGYDGSYFRNNISTLVWDNPLRVSDSATAGPVQGRESLWPNSNLNTGSVSGSLNLPWRSHVTGFVSLGSWTQDDALIPFTINSALPNIALDRPTAQADARVTTTTVNFNTRPTDSVWFNARFRSYDFDNRTPVFHVPNTVSYDTSAAAFAEGGTSPYGYTRKTFDTDVSVTRIKYTALRAAYTHEIINQTFRSFDTTTEDTVRLSADATGLTWLTLRGVYEHAKRSGSGFDEQTLDDIGEQISLQQFDIAERTTNRFSGIVLLTPVSELSFNASASVGRDTRPSTAFGLQSNDTNSYGVGFDYVPKNNVSMGVAYEYDKFDAFQMSRQANPGVQFNDPTRNWSTDGADNASTVTASIDLLKLMPKTDLRVAYNYSHADSTYLYGLYANSTLPAPVQLPTVTNEFQRATVDLRYYITPHLAAGFVYWFDKYNVSDYALGTQTLNSIAQPSFLMLGYTYQPYTANTAWGRLTYLW